MANFKKNMIWFVAFLFCITMIYVMKSKNKKILEEINYIFTKIEIKQKQLAYIDSLPDGSSIASISIDGWKLVYICDECSGGEFKTHLPQCELSNSKSNGRSPDIFSRSAWVYAKNCERPLVLNGDRELPYLWDAPSINFLDNALPFHYCIYGNIKHKNIRKKVGVRIIKKCEN